MGRGRTHYILEQTIITGVITLILHWGGMAFGLDGRLCSLRTILISYLFIMFSISLFLSCCLLLMPPNGVVLVCSGKRANGKEP